MRKSAFTLVEMLVVIIIIGVLAALLLPAVNAIRGSANKAAAAVEISQLDFALQSLKEKYGSYPPDFADVDRVAALAQVKRFIAKAWPRCTRLPRDFRGTELPPQFNAGTALVFWLGGNFDRSQDLDTGRWLIQHIGFSADPQNPFDVDADGDPLPAVAASPGDPVRCASRVNPFYRFPNDRITGSPAANFAFWPKTHLRPTVGAGYVYFRAENRSYATKGFATLAYGAMVDGRHPLMPLPWPWLNADTFQIRSCGPDGAWYSGQTTAEGSCWGHRFGMPEVFLPAFPSVRIADDMGNCWEGTLEDNF